MPFGIRETARASAPENFWRYDMKSIALTAALTLAAASAFAGEIKPMATDTDMIVMAPEPSGSSALTWIIPLVAIAAIALAADD